VDAATSATRRWVESTVIGLNLCPFARRVADAGLIRYVSTDAKDGPTLLGVLGDELRLLAAAPRSEVETTLVIHPDVLGDFLDYNDFLGDADALVRRLGLEGVIQLASFHPLYRFAGTRPEAAENFTNRSPFPMVHLLREDSVSEVAGDREALARIPERNVELLRRIGRAALAERLRGVREP
jgi:hypothetical protein